VVRYPIRLVPPPSFCIFWYCVSPWKYFCRKFFAVFLFSYVCMVVHVYTEVYNWRMAMAQGRDLAFTVDNIPQHFKQKDCHSDFCSRDMTLLIDWQKHVLNINLYNMNQPAVSQKEMLILPCTGWTENTKQKHTESQLQESYSRRLMNK
jgi:hypothetical protein